MNLMQTTSGSTEAELSDGLESVNIPKRHELALAINTLYMVRILAVSRSGEKQNPCEVALDYLFTHGDDKPKFVRRLEFDMPVVLSRTGEADSNKGWYEQTVFVHTSDFLNGVSVTTDGPDDVYLVVRHSQIFVKWPERNAIQNLLASMLEKKVTMGGHIYHPYLQVQEAVDFVKAFTSDVYAITSLQLYGQPIPPPRKSMLVGFIGGDLLYGLLETHFHCVKIVPRNIHLIQANAFDVILFQRRAAHITPDGSNLDSEREFAERLVAALRDTLTPTIELAPPETGSVLDCALNPIGAGDAKESVVVSEYELCRFMPIRTKAWHPRSIAVPVVSDLYEYPGFLETVSQLTLGNFALAFFETNYGHVPKRTWERVRGPRVKVYGHFDPKQTAEVCRASGFMLLHGDSLRDPIDLCNLAAIGIMSGAIPVVIGKELPAPFDELVKTVYGDSELHDFLATYSIEITRERYWLSIFRRLCRSIAGGSFSRALGEAASGGAIDLGYRATPSAEMIAVSKRPQNAERILATYDRQSHTNLGMHLIWNVPAADAVRCREIAQAHADSGVRMTILDQSYNIGSCLNYGIRETSAEHWLKIDDDDFYGRHYVEDIIHWYEATGADVVGKPSALIHFEDDSETYLRESALRRYRRPISAEAHFCGATISGRTSAPLPMFSNLLRNSNDSRWIELIRTSELNVIIADMFNFVINRYHPDQHTWKVSKENIMRDSIYLLSDRIEEWCNAE